MNHKYKNHTIYYNGITIHIIFLIQYYNTYNSLNIQFKKRYESPQALTPEIAICTNFMLRIV